MKKSLLFTKTLSTKLFFTLTALILLTFTANAQFEEKLSVNAAIGYNKPIGPGYYWDMETSQYYPYIFTNFSAAPSFTGGIQYNFSRRLSIEGRIFTLFLWDWNYSAMKPNNDLSYYLSTAFNYMHIGIGLAPKFYIRPGKKINPFAFTEIGISFNDITITDRYENTTYENTFETILSNEFAFNSYLGAGVDLNIIPNLGFFVQGGYYITFLGNSIEANTGEFENFNAIRIEAGVRLNLFKSKKL